MPRLLGALLLVLPKRRLVNQQVRPLRRIHHRSTGTRIAGEYDDPPRAVASHNALRSNRPTVRQLHCLAFAELAPQRAFGNPRRSRLLHVEPPAPLVLAQCVAHGSPTVLRSEYVNAVRFPFPVSPFPDFLPGLTSRISTSKGTRSTPSWIA